MIPRSGPKPVLLIGPGFMGLGLVLFILQKPNVFFVVEYLFVTLFGFATIVVLIFNMLGIALPRKSVAVGFRVNTMLRNLGAAMGPIVALAIMTSSFLETINGRGFVVAQFQNAIVLNIIRDYAVGLKT